MSISIFWALLCSFEIWALARLLEACVSYILFKVRPQSFLISTSACAASLAYCCWACCNACYSLSSQLLLLHDFSFSPQKPSPTRFRPEAVTSKLQRTHSTTFLFLRLDNAEPSVNQVEVKLTNFIRPHLPYKQITKRKIQRRQCKIYS